LHEIAMLVIIVLCPRTKVCKEAAFHTYDSG